jgi:uncharacterized protein (DUF58 family)
VARRPSRRSRQPALTLRGCYLLALCLVLLIVGVGSSSWPISAAGLSVISLLFGAYVSFAARVALLWRRNLELAWWLPRAASSEGLVAQRPFSVQVTLRNLGRLHLGLAELQVLGSRCLQVLSMPPPLPLQPSSEASCELQLRIAQAGQWFVHGAILRLSDRLGLYTLEAYFPSVLRLKVLPRQQPRLVMPAAQVSGASVDQRLGAHTLRQHGPGGDLRELREYVPGDPYKLIAWKASARAPQGRLLVRELERETLLVHYIVLDIGVTMREGQPGQWKLDHALELCLTYLRSVLDGGDRIGFIAFDGALFRHLKPGEGPAQRLRLTERLLDVMNVVDESFVAMTDGELCSAVCRYLRQQEGIDVRVHNPPPMQDVAAWSQIVVAPSGERYHLPQLLAAARKLVEATQPEPSAAATQQRKDPAGTDAVSSSPSSDLAILRQLCLLRGIELPYGQRTAAGRARGLAQALEQCAKVRGARVLLLSDLLGLQLDSPLLTRAALLCRRRGVRLMCLRPETRRYLPRQLLQTATAQRTLEIFSWEGARQEAQNNRALAQLGFHVVAVGPEDGLAQVLAAKNQPRPSMITSKQAVT